MKNSKVLTQTEVTNQNVSLDVSTISRNRIFSQNEKFRMMAARVQKLASVGSECSSRVFLQRLNTIEQIVSYWERNIEVGVQGITNIQQCSEDIKQSETCRQSVEDVATPQISHSCYEAVQQSSSTLFQINQDGLVDQVDHCEVVEQLDNSDVAVEQPNIKESAGNTSFLEIPILPIVKKRGRPKGNTKTVIGLPIKKMKVGDIPFEKKHPNHKDKQMLLWFVSTEDVKKAVAGTILSESSVEQNPNKVSSACLDKCADVNRLRRYFTADGWGSVQHVMSVKRKSPIWLCPNCEVDIKDSGSVCCSGCLEWYHLECINPKTILQQNFWFCQKC
ncbi:hypothetical protein J6590_108762 [Homalodisca vitripennis]|nr:hypothetical protein J6590_108762 [Homalodisca vitripennis]